MSNHYISQCCGTEAKYISSDDVGKTFGQCTKCLEMSGLEAVIDNEYIHNTGYYEKVETNNKPKTLEDKKSRKAYLSMVHQWLKYHYGSATKCESKKCQKMSVNFDWALKKGYEYTKDRKNFKQLCRKCHANYDFNEERRKALIKYNQLRGKTHCLRGHKLAGENLGNNKIYLNKKIYTTRFCKKCREEYIIEYRKKHPDYWKKAEEWKKRTGYYRSDKYRALQRKYYLKNLTK